MLLIWDAIEADFLRDYRITLMEHIDHMSWRHFLVLLNNLSPNGAVAVRIRAETDTKKATTPEKDEEAANAFFSSIVSMG